MFQNVHGDVYEIWVAFPSLETTGSSITHYTQNSGVSNLPIQEGKKKSLDEVQPKVSLILTENSQEVSTLAQTKVKIVTTNDNLGNACFSAT